jgi:hypothetical protein
VYSSLSVFIICVVVPVAMHRDQPYQDAAYVFTHFSNISGWSDNGIAFVIGWMLSCYSVSYFTVQPLLCLPADGVAMAVHWD